MSSTKRSGRVLQNTGWATLAEIGAKVATFALLAVIARRLGDRAFGDYALAFSVGSLSITLADWGHDRVLTREVARDPGQMARYFGNTLALRAAVGLGLVAAVVASAPVLGFRADLRPLLLLAGLASLVDLLTGTCFAAFQAFQRLAFLPLVLVSQRWLTALLGIAVVLLGGSVVAVTVVYLAFAVSALLLAAHLLHRFVVPLHLRVEPRRWAGMVRRATPLGVAGLFGVILFRIDMAMLGSLASAKDVADYAAAYRLLEVTLFLAYSIGAAAYPVYAQRSKQSDPPIADVYGRSLKLATALTLPVAVAFAVRADDLLELLFGDGFRRADEALVLLAPVVLLFPLSYLSGYLLLSQERERNLLVISAVVAIGNVVANALLIPEHTLIAAAANTLAFEALAVALTVVVARRLCGPMPWMRTLAGPVIAAALCSPLLVLIDSVVLAGVAAAAVYVVTLLAFERRFYRDDLGALSALVRPSDRAVPEPRAAAP